MIRRVNRPGTKQKDFWHWPEREFHEIDSDFAISEYIQQKIRKDPANIMDILDKPETLGIDSWVFEHLKQICLELNGLVVELQECCLPKQCFVMTATDRWIFLCAVHPVPLECTAIDYARHTLDNASVLLNRSEYFEKLEAKESLNCKFGPMCRRFYRIFGHTYFHHREVYDIFEERTHLCERFSQLIDKYKLMDKEYIIVPLEAADENSLND